jgi:hypothetical protein
MEDLAGLHWLAANRYRLAEQLKAALASAPGIRLAS